MTETSFALDTLRKSQEFMQTARHLPTLFDLGETELSILEAIEDAQERGEDPSDALAQLAVLETALSQKLEGYVSVIRSLEHLRDARQAEANRLRASAKSADSAIDHLKARLKEYMETNNRPRIDTARFSIRIQKNSRPSIEVLEQMMVPREYIKVVVTESVDKDKVLEHVKQTGEIPPGIEVVHGTHLRVS